MTPAAEPVRPSPPAAFSHSLRVHRGDTGAAGMVFCTNGLEFVARTHIEWLLLPGCAQTVWRGARQLAQGEIRIGCEDSGAFRPRRIPSEFANATA